MLTDTEQLQERKVGERVRLIHIALLICIMAGGTLARVHKLGRTSYWFDEMGSVLYARGQMTAMYSPPQGYFEHAPAIASEPGNRGWRDIWFSYDTNPPLYAILLRIWWQFMGDSDVSGRMMSVVLSVAIIAVVFDVGRLIATPRVALWACALCAASPPQVRYAQEARSYALLGMLGVLSCDIALRVVRYGGGARRYALLGILCAAALFTHFFIAGAVASIAIFGMITLRGRPRVAMVCVVGAAFIVGLWELPSLWNHTQNLREGLGWLVEPRSGLFLRTLVRVASLPAAYLIQPIDAQGIAGAPSLAIVVLPLFLNKRRPGLLLTGLWSIGVIGLVAASDLWLSHGALSYIRYTLAASPMVFVSFATLSDLGGRWTRNLLPGLAVAGALLALPDVYYDELWQKPEARALAQDVRSHIASDDVLVILSAPDMGLYSAGQEYLSLDFYSGPLPCALAVLEAPASEAVRHSIWSHRRVWIVQTFYGADAEDYLGPCRLAPVATTRSHAGRLFLAQSIK